MSYKASTKRYRGYAPDKGIPPVVGRILLIRDHKTADKKIPDAPLLLVMEEATALSQELTDAAVGIILPEARQEAGVPQELPQLILPELPPLPEGELALLDPAKECLILSPDIDALSAYVKRSRESALAGQGLCRPDGQFLQLLSPLGKDISSLPCPPTGILLPLPLCEEEACFEQICSFADLARMTPLTVCLSAKGGTKEERIAAIRGIFRGAVFSRLSILFEELSEGREAAELFSLCHKAFCELSEEAREFNGYVPKGLRLDTPLLALESQLPHGADFLLFDVERIQSLLCGRMPEERTEALQSNLDALLCERMAAAREELYAAISRLPDSPPPWMAHLAGVAVKGT